jgi:16S rRNA (cytosine967-C5)-methyltransferase
MTEVDKEQDRRLARAIAEGGSFGGRLRALVIELWQRTRLDWGFVSDRLSSTFRRERNLGSSERRFVAETLYGMVRHLRRVDAALVAGGGRAGRPTDEQRLMAYLVLEAGLSPESAARVDHAIDWTRARGIDDVIASERKAVTRIALGASLPDWLAEAFARDWGDEAEALAKALNERAPMTVRANLLKTTRDELAAALANEKLDTSPGKWCATALHVDTRTNLFGLAAFKEGRMEAQDEGSQLLAELVQPRGAKIVVDLCAGAGGKTLALAALLGNRGRLYASDIDASKLEELRRRARRAGVSNHQAAQLPADSPGGRWEWPAPFAAIVGKADRVLVDAPCSGVGSFRRNPEARWRLAADDLPRFAARQRMLIDRAAELTAPGGLIIYGTCTVLRVENDDVVDAALAARQDLELVPPPDAAYASRDGRFFQVTPHRHGTDGFFGAVLRKRAS